MIAASVEDRTRNITDAELLDYATAEGRAVVTENVADFAVLASRYAAEGRTHARIVFTHPAKFSRASSAYPRSLIRSLREFLKSPPPLGDAWVWWL